ncbi:uncharacterized protein LOC122643422 [Telopea speciosissima]|uniref:uncharacterized protein LOC122643422 n=1 Tax=Telopea speciosissima TaxID=54955 RepID=UPI001CC3DC45|nr:uncharacterized protein LOC122643422 [Telopea speciosissima]
MSQMPNIYQCHTYSSHGVAFVKCSLGILNLGIDVIGKITPKASNGHEFILATIDYFTKWVEAQSYAVLTAAKVEKFIKENIICSQLTEGEWMRARYEEINLLDERRMKAMDNLKKYQQRMARAFSKEVRPRSIEVGDLVLREQRAPIHDPQGKFRPNWSGPYKVKAILLGSTVRLMDINRENLWGLVNMDQLKKYFV